MSKKPVRPFKPRTKREWALYRAALSCRVARDCIEGRSSPPCNTTTTEYAIYNLCHAIEDIALAMQNTVDSTSKAR